jgi:hypothetical protein
MLWILRTAFLIAVWITSAVLLSAAFWFTYARLVPLPEHIVDLHFDYKSSGYAQAAALFPAMLRAGQDYRVVFEMLVPDIVHDARNFMVKARLAHGPRSIATFSRPVPCPIVMIGV